MDAARTVAGLPQVMASDRPHAPEHSLEVHLPFLQHTLGAFSVVPLVVGDASFEEVEEVLDILWGGPETLIVVSTDLSHFLDYAAARQLDAVTAAAIESMEPEAIGHEQACGRIPLGGLLRLARQRRMGIERLDLRNSGDTAGPRQQVVGYGAWALYEGAA
jgi:AmmeMemoRadiSam system protein B